MGAEASQPDGDRQVASHGPATSAAAPAFAKPESAAGGATGCRADLMGSQQCFSGEGHQENEDGAASSIGQLAALASQGEPHIHAHTHISPHRAAVGLHKPEFEKCIGDVDPFLSLRCEKSKFSEFFADDVLWVLVENVSSCPVMLMPIVTGGRFLKQRDERMPSLILEPGRIHKLTRLSTDQERYRMDCYASGLPHFPCDGISKRVDPTSITLVCQPAARDSEGWYAMSGEDGVSRPEAWAVYIDCYVKCEIVQTCVFSDERRPLRRLNVTLEDVRYCQDSCGRTFRDGRSLESTVKELKQGETTVAELGIRVVAFGSVYFALDNRRLKCVKLAFSPKQTVAVLLADLNDPGTKKEWDAKFTVGKRIPTHEEARRVDARNVGQLDPKQRSHRKQTQDVAITGPVASDAPVSPALKCAQCSQSFTKPHFSAAQLKKKEARRCRQCVTT